MPDLTTYAGLYTLDAVAGTVTHHIDTASLPSLVGTDQIRHYDLRGTWLILTAASSRGTTTLDWTRCDATPSAGRPA